MTTEQLPSQPSTSDTPQWGNRPPRRWSTRKTVVSVAIAAVVVAGGGAAIYAASGSSSSSSTAQGGPGGGQMMQGGGPGGDGSGPAAALHGEYVVSDGNGGYSTELTQVGTVTALSATELTAKSTDGYTKTYTIGSADLSGIASGDTVTLTATESGTTATLENVTEGTMQQPPGQS